MQTSSQASHSGRYWTGYFMQKTFFMSCLWFFCYAPTYPVHHRIKASSRRHYYSSGSSCVPSINTNLLLCWHSQTLSDTRPQMWYCPPARWSSSLKPAATAAAARQLLLSLLSLISHEMGTGQVLSVFCQDPALHDSGEAMFQRPWKWVEVKLLGCSWINIHTL